jgi:hypothetical protein
MMERMWVDELPPHRDHHPVVYYRSLVGFKVSDNHGSAMDVTSSCSSGSPEMFGGVSTEKVFQRKAKIYW